MFAALASPVWLAMAWMLVQETSTATVLAPLETAENRDKARRSTATAAVPGVLKVERGELALAYSLAVPPGRRGLVPDLTVTYRRGADDGPFGAGFALSLPVLERSTKDGLANEKSPLVLVGLGAGTELVEVAKGLFRERIEGETPILAKAREDGRFEVYVGDGRSYVFGESRLEVDGVTMRWRLDHVEDDRGNRVAYAYEALPGSDEPQLTVIRYNDGLATVHFDYENRPDARVSSRFGTKLWSRHRLREVRTFAAEAPVRRYWFAYDDGLVPAGGRLSAIGCDASDGTKQPTWRFGYAEAETPRHWTVAGGDLRVEGQGRALVDVDADGRPDVLDTAPGGWRFRRNLAGKAFAQWEPLASSPSLRLGAGSTVADLDRDGTLDVVTAGDLASQGLRVYFGGGPSPFSRQESFSPEVSVRLSDPTAELVDLNLDGRVDFLHTGSSDTFAWLRTATGGFGDALVAEPVPPGFQLGEEGVSLADLDGDRLPDLVRADPSEGRVLVAYADGLGVFRDPVELVGVPSATQGEAWFLRDLSGDGVADLVRVRPSGVEVRWNRPGLGLIAGPRAAFAGEDTQGQTVFVDWDANGTVDVVRIPGKPGLPLEIVDLVGREVGRLVRFDNGEGYEADLVYGTVADAFEAARETARPWSRGLPYAEVVLVKVDEHEARGFARTTTIAVRDPYHDAPSGEFRGFGWISETRAGDSFVEERRDEYRIDVGDEHEARKHKVTHHAVLGAGRELSRTEHGYEVVERAPGVQAATATWTDVWHLEGLSSVDAARTRIERRFDAWGNPVEVREFGRVDAMTATDVDEDARSTETQYCEALGRWRLVRKRAVHARDGALVAAERRSYVAGAEQGRADCESSLVRSVELWTEGTAWITSRLFDHDRYGNVVVEADGAGGRRSFDFDASGVFPVRERLSLGSQEGSEELVTSLAHDPGTGTLVAWVDPTRARTRRVIDGLGRVVQVYRPGDLEGDPSIEITYHQEDGVPLFVETRTATSGAEVQRTGLYQDGLGRPFAEVTENDDGRGAIVSVLRRYGADGEVVEERRGMPTIRDALTAGVVSFEAPAEQVKSLYRDALGRETARLDGDGRWTRHVFRPLTKTTFFADDLDPSSPFHETPRVHHFDGLGRLVNLEESTGSELALHDYTHDAVGRIIEYVDPLGAQTLYRYDGAGRLVATESLDVGTITQAHDGAGRVVLRGFSDGSRVELSYDAVGRVTNRRTYAADGELEGSTLYAYDGRVEGAGRQGVDGIDPARGRLSEVRYGAGATRFAYDVRGNVVAVARRFEGEDGKACGGGRSFAMTYDYDRSDRLVRTTYPDQEAVERRYTARGREASVSGVVRAATYDAQGRWTLLVLWNGVEESRTLDAVGRIFETQTRHADAGLIYGRRHTYDVRGSRSVSEDLRADLASSGPNTESARDAEVGARQVFSHDGLTRLTAAQGPYGSFAYEHAVDGNLLMSEVGTVGYEPERPHVATAVGPLSLRYDAAGRLERIGGDTLRHDVLGHLVHRSRASGEAVTLAWDHERRPAVLRSERGMTCFLGDEAEVVVAPEPGLVKHLTFDGQPLAHRLTPVAVDDLSDYSDTVPSSSR